MTLVTTRVGLCYTFGDGSSGQQALPLDRYAVPKPFPSTLFHEHDDNRRSGRRLVARPHAVAGLPPLLHADGATCSVACGGAHVVVAVRATRQCECSCKTNNPFLSFCSNRGRSASSTPHTLVKLHRIPVLKPYSAAATKQSSASLFGKQTSHDILQDAAGGGRLPPYRFGAGDATRAVSLARLLPARLCWCSHSACM